MNIGFLELVTNIVILLMHPVHPGNLILFQLWLLKLCVNELTPVITKMVNLPVYQGCVPEAWKLSRLVPILKKLI